MDHDDIDVLQDALEMAQSFASNERQALDHERNAEYLDLLDATVAKARDVIAKAKG